MNMKSSLNDHPINRNTQQSTPTISCDEKVVTSSVTSSELFGPVSKSP